MELACFTNLLQREDNKVKKGFCFNLHILASARVLVCCVVDGVVGMIIHVHASNAQLFTWFVCASAFCSSVLAG